jgi:hypothetical protein
MRGVLALLLVTLLQQPSRDAAPVKPAVETGLIKGRVVADDGTPVRRAVVTIGSENFPPQSIYTDGEGRYEARRLPAGSYRVSVRPNMYQGQFLAPLPPAIRVKPVPLAEGQTIEWYDLTLRRAGAIVGRIVDQHGDPVSGIQVQAQRTERTSVEYWASQSSDEFGRFRVYRLEPGEYEVLARPSSGLSDRIPGQNVGFVETYYPSTVSRREAARVTVRAGQDTSNLRTAARVRAAAARQRRRGRHEQPYRIQADGVPLQ